MRVLLLAVVVIFALAAPTRADVEDGLAAAARGDYATALKEWLPLAKQGNADAQYNLGKLYWRGLGVPKDDVEAVKWYHRSAEQGHPEAQVILGRLYFAGAGVPQHYGEAMKWLRKAAEQGHPEAQFELGLKYENGHGTEMDLVQAHMWYNLSVALGGEGAAIQRHALAKKMTPAQVAKAQRLAREWWARYDKAD
jgi:TPR repeat protein